MLFEMAAIISAVGLVAIVILLMVLSSQDQRREDAKRRGR